MTTGWDGTVKQNVREKSKPMKKLVSLLALFIINVSIAFAGEMATFKRQVYNHDSLTFTVTGIGWHKERGEVILHGVQAYAPSARVTVMGAVIGDNGISVTLKYNGYGMKFVTTLLVKYTELDEMVKDHMKRSESMVVKKIEYSIGQIIFTDEKKDPS